MLRRSQLLQNRRNRKRRVVVDTTVLVAGISAFKQQFVPGRNSSADLLHSWVEENNSVWLITDTILDEYKDVLRGHGVRSAIIGTVVNLLRERAENIIVRWLDEVFGMSPDVEDIPFWACSKRATQIFF